ncbi:hypothetical protein JCM11957_10670 [Caminibacter profundus]
METIALNDKLFNLVDIAKSYTEVEVIKADDRSVTIYLKEFDLKYRLFDFDWYFIEALRIMFLISVKDGYAHFTDDYHLFSGYELHRLRDAIREDYNHLGGIYTRYFFDPENENSIKDIIEYRDVRAYCDFINIATSF